MKGLVENYWVFVYHIPHVGKVIYRDCYSEPVVKPKKCNIKCSQTQENALYFWLLKVLIT